MTPYPPKTGSLSARLQGGVVGCERLMVAGIGHRKERNRRRSSLDFQFLLSEQDIGTPS